MNHPGACTCGRWLIVVSTDIALHELNPRICDCSYCAIHPSAVISEPGMIVHLIGNDAQLVVNRNGDRLANFYHCRDCGALLAVGREIEGVVRGAVNAWLLVAQSELGESMQIQPRLLSASEKIERWSRLWGRLEGV